MGSRTLPTECPHGVVIDWGDFGPSNGEENDPTEDCEECRLAIESEKVAEKLALRRRIQRVCHDYFDGQLFLVHEDEHRSRADLVSDLVEAALEDE